MYINSLIKIKNAQEAEKKSLKIPFAKMDLAIAEFLLKHGFLKNVEVKGKLPKQVIEIDLKDEKAIKGLKLVSRPSRRIYSGCKNIKRVKSGYGIGVISTSKGIMGDQDARKQKLGGQVLFEIW
ncbi:MAG: 30S ribosomal protein S8 [Patescibacteria group bacterium]